MSFGEVHLTVFWCGEIHAASLGEDQFSFGATSPPSSLMVSLIFWCSSGKRWFGGSRDGDDSWSSSSESESCSGSSGRGGANAVDVGSQSSSSSSAAADGSSLESIMPSSRMYSMNSGGSLMTRERMHDVRYLTYALAMIMSVEASKVE